MKVGQWDGKRHREARNSIEKAKDGEKRPGVNLVHQRKRMSQRLSFIYWGTFIVEGVMGFHAAATLFLHFYPTFARKVIVFCHHLIVRSSGHVLGLCRGD